MADINDNTTLSPVMGLATVRQAPPNAGWSDLVSDLRMRVLLHSTRDPTIFCAAGGRMLHLNLPAETLFGIREAEVLDQPLTRLISPEDRHLVSVMLANSHPAHGELMARQNQLDAINSRGELVSGLLATNRSSRT